jgi:hypothetical protein
VYFFNYWWTTHFIWLFTIINLKVCCTSIQCDLASQLMHNQRRANSFHFKAILHHLLVLFRGKPKPASLPYWCEILEVKLYILKNVLFDLSEDLTDGLWPNGWGYVVESCQKCSSYQKSYPAQLVFWAFFVYILKDSSYLIFTYNESIRWISSLLDNNEFIFYWVLILLQVDLLLFTKVVLYVLHKLFALNKSL